MDRGSEALELTKEHRDAIDEIMDHFDFEMVHRAMRFIGWKWSSDVGDGSRTPTVSELRVEARRLLRTTCVDPSSGGMKCGGLCVRKNEFKLELCFEMSSWDVDLGVDDED